ncbi:MAG: DUF3108 domain-containing protein [bacterium]|jgi:hypothetical protein|nr:DUF3108 domain-containing protein [candidate division KSB1 bacterium]MDH7559975.1 DUF3108 domain-containing protein [bacterium]
MTLSLTLLSVLCCCWSAGAGDAQPADTEHERLTYEMQYGGFQVGSFRTEVLPGENGALTLQATMQTSPLYHRFFWVDNVYLAHLDAELLLRRLVKEIRQKNLSHTMDITFDQEAGVARTTDGRTWEAPAGTYDILSLVYHLRAFPLAPKEKRTDRLDGEGLTWEVIAENIGQEEVETPAGMCRADKVLLRTKSASSRWRAWKTDILTNRLSAMGSGVLIWFSAGGTRVPVQMVFRASPFDLRMNLKKCEGASLTGGER